MSFKEPNNVFKIIKELVRSEIRNNKGLKIFKVTHVNSNSYSVDVRDLHFKKLEYKNVPLAGTGLGHLKGFHMLPNVDDFVVVGFFGLESAQPIVLGNVYDFYSQNSDEVPGVEINEFLLCNRLQGGFLFMNSDNEFFLMPRFRITDPITGAELNSSSNTPRLTYRKDGTIEIVKHEGTDTETWIKILPDNTIEIRGEKDLNINVTNDVIVNAGGNVNVTAVGSSSITSSGLTVNSGLTVTGTLNVTGAAEFNSTIHSVGNILSDGSILDTAGNTNHHVH